MKSPPSGEPEERVGKTSQIGYAGAGTRRAAYRFVVPRRVARGAAVGAVAAGIVGLIWIHKALVVRSYEPHWHQWVSPVAVLISWALVAVAFMATGQDGRREAWKWALPAILPGILCTIWLVVGPRVTVCGESAYRVMCASNLRRIGQAILVYSMDHGDQPPDSFGTLLLKTDITPDVFICPLSFKRIAKGKDRDWTASLLNSSLHRTYTYCGADQKWPVPDAFVLAYEDLDAHSKDGINILFGDGHVEFIDRVLAGKMVGEIAAGHNPPRAEKVQ